VSKLAAGEAEVLYLKAPNQSVLNYMTMRSGITIHNLAVHLPLENALATRSLQRILNGAIAFFMITASGLPTCITLVYRVSYLADFARAKTFSFPYRETFLHYRYLHEPEKQPALPDQPTNQSANQPSLTRRVLQKLGMG